jgi:AraC-like DNA-binding protein
VVSPGGQSNHASPSRGAQRGQQPQRQLEVTEVVGGATGRRAPADRSLPPGWLRALTDERLRPALQSMHAEPGRPWRLDELARASSRSRTSFAERFRVLAGVPLLTYLNAWRMQLAQRALRDRDTRVGGLGVGTRLLLAERVQQRVQTSSRDVAAALPRACRSESDRRKSRWESTFTGTRQPVSTQSRFTRLITVRPPAQLPSPETISPTTPMIGFP